jgi:hypothetical protein
MITQISSMEFKKPHHCHDDNGTGIDYFAYRNGLGVLTDMLHKSVNEIICLDSVKDTRIISMTSRQHRSNINGMILQMTRYINWYLLEHVCRKS